MQIVPGHIGVLLRHLIHDVEPEGTGMGQDIGLVDHGHIALAPTLTR